LPGNCGDAGNVKGQERHDNPVSGLFCTGLTRMILLGILLAGILLLGKEETSAAGWFFICLVVVVVLVLI
jgi:hypothetical protein